jgi:hypothetical protein
MSYPAFSCTLCGSLLSLEEAMSDDDVREECYASEVAWDEHLARGQPLVTNGDGSQESRSSLYKKPTTS